MAFRRCCRWLGRLAKKVWFCVLSGLKTGIEYKASLGGGGCCKLQGLPRRGEGKTKSFDCSLKNCAIIQGFADRSEVCKIKKILV